MALIVRHGCRFIRVQFAYWARTGSWWVPVSVVVLAIAALVAVTSQVVVPHAVYVLF